jgi:hypothetical protein
MKLLVIISSHDLNKRHSNNIEILNSYLCGLPDTEVSYCGISNQDDFHNYEDIISFKYKVINSQRQLSKLCDFITDNKSTLNYDWFIKIRPDAKLLEPINFELLSDKAINARARVYRGPKQIKYGLSTGVGCWETVKDCSIQPHETEVILDEGLIIFHNNIIQLNAFDKIAKNLIVENEWVHTRCWKSRNIKFNVIGINLVLTDYNAGSGDVNM